MSIRTPAPDEQAARIAEHFYDRDDDMDGCGQCDGEGYTYHCIDGFCVNAEDGCRLCQQRCDFCNPRAITDLPT